MDDLYSYLDIAELAGRFLKGEITQQERISLDAWIAQSDQNKALWKKLTRREYLEQQLESWREMDPGAAWEKLLPAIRSAQAIEDKMSIDGETSIKGEMSIEEETSIEAEASIEGETPMKGAPSIGGDTSVPLRVLHTRIRSIAAAALVVLLAGSAYLAYTFLYRPAAAPPPKIALAPPAPILPGSHNAQLVLSNGKVIGLGPAAGQIREANGAKVENERNELKYALAGANLKDDTLYNSVITPRGGEYQLVLSDGTKVWLNAASSIRYPVCFAGKERRVSLVGEAYFEVAKSPGHPFVVTTRQSTVTVLGTCFNIKTYPDESADKTSLVDGAVRVGSASSPGVVLQPGTQAVVEGGKEIAVGAANLEEALAWKKGLFVFQSESLECIARKLSRWYNIDIVFADPSLRSIRFTGRVRRYDDMNALLKMISATSHAVFMQQGMQLVVGSK